MERRRPVAAQVLACVAVLSLVPGSAGAEPRSSPATATLAWPTYSFSTFEYVATATFTAVAIDTALVSPRPGHLRGGVLFDDGARNALRASDAGTRKAIRTVDDVIVGSAVGFPFLVDAVLTAAIVRRSPNVAKEMTLIDADTLGLTAALHGLTSFLVSRERPGARTCDSATLGDKSQCGAGRYRSFFSADAALTFASAGLICSHHTKLRLFGAADALTCVGSLAAAGTAAVLGVIGDAHYATDAITGAIVGSAVGFGVPYLHYKEARRPEDGNVAGRPHLDVHIVPTWNGASIRGRF